MEPVSVFTFREQVNMFEPGEICLTFEANYRLNNVRYTLSESIKDEWCYQKKIILVIT